MSKEIIKNKVRESLLDRLREVNKTPEGESSEPKNDDNTEGKSDTGKKDYAAVQAYFDKDLAFSQVAVMKKSTRMGR
jgi:hypothetical protein